MVAKFTSASATPGWRAKIRCTRTAHELHVMPAITNSSELLSARVIPNRFDPVALPLNRSRELIGCNRDALKVNAYGGRLHIDGGNPHTGQRAQHALDRALAVFAGDVGHGKHMSRHDGCLLPRYPRIDSHGFGDAGYPIALDDDNNTVRGCLRGKVNCRARPAQDGRFGDHSSGTSLRQITRTPVARRNILWRNVLRIVTGQRRRPPTANQVYRKL